MSLQFHRETGWRNSKEIEKISTVFELMRDTGSVSRGLTSDRAM
jgi:hypothetical protein